MFRDETPGQRWLRDMELVKDPRRFCFALVCNCCGDCQDSLQATRHHISKLCRQRPSVNLTCGHCGETFGKWAEFVEHIITKEIHLSGPIAPQYAMLRIRPPHMTGIPMQPST